MQLHRVVQHPPFSLLEPCVSAPGLLIQQSPTFLAPGTGSVKDNFSMDRVGGGWGTGGRVQAIMQTKLCFLAHCSLTGHRLVVVFSLGIGDPCCNSHIMEGTAHSRKTALERREEKRRKTISYSYLNQSGNVFIFECEGTTKK